MVVEKYPYRVLENNNTESIVDDIEKISFFNIEKFLIVGGSGINSVNKVHKSFQIMLLESF